MSIVQARGLTLRIPTRGGWVHAGTDLDLTLTAGEVTALIGESGCGKSTLASALVGLLPPRTQVTGSLRIDGTEMAKAGERAWRPLRGRRIGLVAQSAATCLTPVRLVEGQLAETIAAHGAAHTVAGLLERVGLNPTAAGLYPHELSGGMAQRVAIALALAGDPAVLIADEPTASLDPELAARTLHLLRAAADDGVAVLLITHDLQGLVDADVADSVAVMYAGRIIEHGPTVLTEPTHDYSRALLDALPSRGFHPIPGQPPDLTDPAGPAAFSTRLSTVPVS